MGCSQCPICKQLLSSLPWADRRVYRCQDHHGFQVKKEDQAEVLSPLVSKIIHNTQGTLTRLICAECNQPMRLYSNKLQRNFLQCYSCNSCDYLWFLQQDLNIVLNDNSPTNAPKTNNDDSIEVEDIELIDTPAFFGLMIKKGAPPTHTFPYICLFIICISGFFVLHNGTATKKSLDLFFWFFHSWEPFARFGAPIFTSLFIHASWEHLASNAFFLFLFGENVEDTLGTQSFLQLIIFSVLGSKFLFLLLSGSQPTVSIGMSGIVCGVIAFFCLKFQDTKLSINFYLLRIRLWVPAFIYGAFYFGIEALLAAHQSQGGSSDINHLAHLGGAIGGAVYFAFIDSGKSST